jgi:predicted MarR family transcription regulator
MGLWRRMGQKTRRAPVFAVGALVPAYTYIHVYSAFAWWLVSCTCAPILESLGAQEEGLT